MKTKENNTAEKISDPFLDSLFDNMPLEKVNEETCIKIMERIQEEEKKKEKRTFWAVIAASVFFILIFVVGILMGAISFPVKKWLSFFSLSDSPLIPSLMISAVSLFLLFTDYQLRKIFYKKYNKTHLK